MSWSPIVYPSNTPSSAPLSYTPLSAYSPRASYSYSPVSTKDYYDTQLMLTISKNTLYITLSILCLVLMYSTYMTVYYYNAYKKEKGRRKKYDEVQRKFHLTSGFRP